MKPGNFEALSPEQIDGLEAALDKINLIDGIGQAIKKHKEEEDRLRNLVRSVSKEAVRTPEGYLFAVTSRSNSFEISDWLPKASYEDAGWAASTTQRSFRPEGIFEKYVYLADKIEANPLYGHNPGTAFAYNPFMRERCKISGDGYTVDLVSKDQLPDLLVNPPPQEEIIEATFSRDI